jgi:tetratricopeptide (TPR) repeat protein
MEIEGSFMNRSFSFFALLAVALAVYPAIAHSDGKNAESFVYTEEVYRAELALPRNMSSFNRAIGILGDLVREERRLFSAKNSGANDETADKVEELLNEASLLGAQKQYDEAYAALEKAFAILSASIKKLVVAQGK